jgi:hypothetical protein
LVFVSVCSLYKLSMITVHAVLFSASLRSLQYRGSGDKKECVNGIGGRVTEAVMQVLVQHH